MTKKPVYYFEDIPSGDYLLYFATDLTEGLMSFEKAGIMYTHDETIFRYLSALAAKYEALDALLSEISDALSRARKANNFAEMDNLKERHELVLQGYGGSMHKALERFQKELEIEGQVEIPKGV